MWDLKFAQKIRARYHSSKAWFDLEKQEIKLKRLKSDTELPLADAVMVVMGPTGA